MIRLFASNRAVTLSAITLLGVSQGWCEKVSTPRITNTAISSPALREAPVPLRAGASPCTTHTDSKGDARYDARCSKLQAKLIEASGTGDLAAMREALSEGADVEGVIDNAFPSLHQAAAHGEIAAVRLLLDNGADVNRVAGVDHIPLSEAIYGGHTDVAKLLVERGVITCYKTFDGTPDALAEKQGDKEMAEMLKTARKAAQCK